MLNGKKSWVSLVLALLMVFLQIGPCAADSWEVTDDEWDAAWSDEQWSDLDALLSDESSAADIDLEYTVQVARNDLSVQEGLDEDVMNILLLGVDNAGSERIDGRSDAILVLSVNKKDGTVKLASIARDLYVQLPVIGYTNRINTAYVFGGANLAMKTVNALFGLNIERYVTINFSGFKSVVDLLGGVELELSPGEAAEISRASTFVGAGKHQLDGAQCLAYVRIRSVDSIFGRGERHRIFLTAMLNKVRSGNGLSQILEVAETLLPYMDTNMTTQELMTMIFNVLPYVNDVATYSSPETGDFKYETTASGASVVTADIPSIASKLRAFIYGTDPLR